jgi:HD-GYP domain-containing protein (c-di-GMP phosphodiesterase class II)
MSRFVHPQANSAFSAIFGEPRIKKHLCTLHRHEEGTYGHSLAVAALSLDLGARNGISKDARYLTLGAGASLHDIGKLLVSSAILKSKGELTPEQRAEMDNHPCYGVKLVNGTRFLLGIDPEGGEGHHRRPSRTLERPVPATRAA